MLKYLPVFLVLVTLGGVQAYAQVEVKQSVTTNDNRHKTSIKSETNSNAPSSICLGLVESCDSNLVYMKLIQGTLNVTQTKGAFMIHYCSDKCHTYRLDVNGTIRTVKSK